MAAKRPKKIRDTWNLRISKVKKTGDTLISKSQKVTDNYQSIWAPLNPLRTGCDICHTLFGET